MRLLFALVRKKQIRNGHANDLLNPSRRADPSHSLSASVQPRGSSLTQLGRLVVQTNGRSWRSPIGAQPRSPTGLFIIIVRCSGNVAGSWKRGKPANPAMLLSYESPVWLTTRLLRMARIDALTSIFIILEGIWMQRRTGILRSLSLRIFYGICMRYKIYHDLKRYTSRTTRLRHNRAIYIMSNMTWIHSLLNEARKRTEVSTFQLAMLCIYIRVHEWAIQNTILMCPIHWQVAVASKASLFEHIKQRWKDLSLWKPRR